MFVWTTRENKKSEPKQKPTNKKIKRKTETNQRSLTKLDHISGESKLISAMNRIRGRMHWPMTTKGNGLQRNINNSLVGWTISLRTMWRMWVSLHKTIAKSTISHFIGEARILNSTKLSNIKELRHNCTVQNNNLDRRFSSKKKTFYFCW